MHSAAARHPMARWRDPLVLAGGCAVLTLAAIAVESVVALAITLMEGVVALGATGLAGLAGLWVVRWLRLADGAAGRVIVGAGLGIGGLSLLTLLPGVAGALSRPLAIILVTGLAIAGAAGLVVTLRERQRTAPHRRELAPLHLLWLLVVPFAAITAAAACLPPGVLWREEGFAYDVLEYHLAVPKIFWTQGRIRFLDNNVYSNFPLNSEMLSLLMMYLRGDPIEAAYMAVFVNLGLAGLFVGAAWWAGAAFGRQAGIISGVMAGTTPWITYLSGIAYVEPGMLAMGMASLAVLLHAVRSGEGTWRPFAAAGLLAGLACGFKYTAVPMIALPLALVPLFGSGAWLRRVQQATICAVATLVTLSPWLIRNVMNTGNPVFPLAYSIFGSRPDVWSPDADAVWQHAHSLASEQNPVPAWQRALERTLAEPLMGPGLFVLAAIGAIRRRDRWTGVLLAILLIQLAVWLAFTHLFARFAVVMLLPLCVLAGRSIEEDKAIPGTARAGQSAATPASMGGDRLGPAGILIVAVVLLGAVLGLYRVGRLYYDHTRPGGQRLEAYGHTDWFVTGQWPSARHWGAVNALPADSRVMLVGEARTFYLLTPFDYAVVFNRHPLAEAVERLGDPVEVITWLAGQRFTHVLVDWSEMVRLARTYGFYRALAPEVIAELEASGLRRVDDYRLREDQAPFATLYEVPQP